MILDSIRRFFMRIPDDYWAKWNWPIEIDDRDFKVENVLWLPSKEELKKVPKSINLLYKAKPKYYINQWCIPNCTASAFWNYMIVTETIERNNNTINTKKWVDETRILLNHILSCNEKWEYLENVLKTVKKNWIKAVIDWKLYKLTIDWYAYTIADVNSFMYRISKWYPIYYAIRWNKQIRWEMSKWELKTSKFTPTWWHAIVIVWYDKEYFYCMNSWRKNDWNYSTFKVKKSVLLEMLNYWLANWRWWIVYNHDDINVKYYEDYIIDLNTEAWKAVKWCYDNNIMKWENWRFYPWRWLTRLETAVIIYRLAKYLFKFKK